MATEIRDNLIVGIDLGANSLGWAVLNAEHDKPGGIVDCGVRVFDPGINIDPQSGKNSSRNLDRRTTRGRRRLLARRHMRIEGVERLLKEAGLWPTDAKPDFHRSDPYKLRADALHKRLDPFDLGLVFYHLAHRRGFLSNRKAPKKKDDDHGKVKEATDKLDAEIKASGAGTLGEYLSRLDSHRERIRRRYTLRAWYEDEFDTIWPAQQPHHPATLTEEFRKRLRRAIFHQRPLKIQTHLIGNCDLEPERKRAPMALLLAQRVRLLQDVNHTRAIDPDGKERPLTIQERSALIDELERVPDLKMTKSRKLMGLPKGYRLNLENGGRTEYLGNRTAAAMRGAFGERWDGFSDAQRESIVEDWMTIESEKGFACRARRVWKLDAQSAQKLAEVSPEDGYSRHSRQAQAALLPHLEAGLSYAEARKAAYPDRASSRANRDTLSPVEDLRNPIVQRALAELRRAVNHLIRKHGKPALIRLELARDLKKSGKQREEIWKRNKQNEGGRKKAADRILNEVGIANPSRDDVEKVLLLQECGGVCPYSGKGIDIHDLFGDAPRFEVEHIVPFSRSLDNSFMNKTLCLTSLNREKGKRTPFEAFGSDPEKWNDVVGHVKSFKGDARDAKLRRFLMEEVELEEAFAEFSSQQLNDTRYASRKAREYLEQLYPDDGKLHVQVSPGMVTAHLRRAWDLNRLLGDPNADRSEAVRAKNRSDHRHHAIDAVVIALSGPAIVKDLCRAAAQSVRPNRFPGFATPWENFGDTVRQALDKIVVSHRVSRRAQGALHNDTFYGLIRAERGSDHLKAVVRKPVEALSESEVKEHENGDNRGIVDKSVRETVLAKLAELDLGEPKKAFAERANHPHLTTPDGRQIPIHKVRVFQSVVPTQIGEGPRRRYVKPDSNHHLEVFECKHRNRKDGTCSAVETPPGSNPPECKTFACKVLKNKKGDKRKTAWTGKIVDMLEAVRRKKLGLPIVRRQDNDGNPLVFSLAQNEMVEVEWDGRRALATVTGISNNDIRFAEHNDGRKAVERRKLKEWNLYSYKLLFEGQCRKMVIDAIGGIHESHD